MRTALASLRRGARSGSSRAGAAPRLVLALAAAQVLACGGPLKQGTAPASAPPSAPAPAPSASPGREGAPAKAPGPALPEAKAGASEPAEAAAVTEFPPPDFEPPSPRSASPGDGHWTRFGPPSASERPGEAPLIARTVVHPHPESRWIVVTVAAVDLRRVEIGLVAGTEDLAWAKLPVGKDAGLVPSSVQDRLVAVMNGGFQPKHGRWGMMASGVVVSPPREEGCTIALHADGSVRLGPWSELSAARSSMTSFRQTPPCLVHDGALHPSLIAGRDKTWAGHAADLTTRRRSAAGIDRTGQVLYYAIGEEADPRWLAEGLRAAGATTALELDINWYWTRFLLFGRADTGSLRVVDTLIPKMEHLANGYVERASTRDFFFLAKR